MDFSVLVLLYNSEKKALERTLESVLRQKGVSFEIVLADDCSKNDCLAQAVEYLKDKGVKVKVSHQETNGGTVNNILDALRLCDGKYIKPIGAGDLLFDNKCLYIARNTFDKDQEIVLLHSMLQSYRIQENGMLELLPSHDPSDIRAQIKEDIKRVNKNILLYHGWIVGATMFYRKDAFIDALEKMKKSVVYCEDLSQALYLLEGKKLKFIKRPTIYYEVGTGISTTTESRAVNRLYQDHLKFWEWAVEEFPANKLAKKSLKVTKFEGIDNLMQRRIKILLTAPGILTMVLRQKLDKKLYDVKEEGFIEEILKAVED